MNDKLLALGRAITEASRPRPEGIRQGQYVFNTVHSYLPDEANKLRGSVVDPFYKDHLIPLFWTTLVDLVVRDSGGLL